MLTLSPEELTAIKLSLRVATWATLASLPLGILVAMILARGRFYGRALLNALVLLPLVLPPVVTGYVLLLLFGRHGPLGRWLDAHFGIVFAFRWTGAALACAIMGFPLMVRAIQLSAAAVDRRLEQAAGTLGANPAYDAPVDFEFANKAVQVRLRIRLGLYEDETSAVCHWHIPETHYLESWSDARAYDGTVSVQQPLIAPLYHGKSAYELLAVFWISQ